MNRAALLANTRQICLALPAATERLSHGQPAWFVADKKQFAVYLDHHHDDHRSRLWCAVASRRLVTELDQRLVQDVP